MLFGMRGAFTLIELMIVIAIIAIIAAIAIPNLLESRITANEAAAATSLRTGIFPAQITFKDAAYIDIDHDGLGCYSNRVTGMAGSTAATVTLGLQPTVSLALLGPSFNTTELGNGDVAVGAYDYICATAAGLPPSANSEDLCERYFIAMAWPDSAGQTGRRGFGLNQSGTVLVSKQIVADNQVTKANMLGVGVLHPWMTDGRLSSPAISSSFSPWAR